jgi:hypothetical protein
MCRDLSYANIRSTSPCDISPVRRIIPREYRSAELKRGAYKTADSARDGEISIKFALDVLSDIVIAKIFSADICFPKWLRQIFALLRRLGLSHSHLRNAANLRKHATLLSINFLERQRMLRCRIFINRAKSYDSHCFRVSVRIER